MELSIDVTFKEDMAYQRSRRLDWDSDDSQEILVSSSPPAEREIMDDDVVEPTDLVDLVVTNLVPRDIVGMGQKRRPAWARQTLQDAEGHATPHPLREKKRP